MARALFPNASQAWQRVADRLLGDGLLSFATTGFALLTVPLSMVCCGAWFGASLMLTAPGSVLISLLSWALGPET